MNAPVTMQLHAENYLDERHQLGYSLHTTGYAVRSFAHYADALGHEGPLTVEVMATWARRTKVNGDSPTTWVRRLKKLRPFARYLQQFDPHTEVPDHTVFGRVGQRLVPHIYSEQEIVDLLAATRRLSPALRGATYETLFGLLAATGLRISEAGHLTDADVDLKLGMLTVRQTKFAKSRYVPLHPSTVECVAAVPRAVQTPYHGHGRDAVLHQHAGPASGVRLEPASGESGLPAPAGSIGLGQPWRPRCSAYPRPSSLCRLPDYADLGR